MLDEVYVQYEGYTNTHKTTTPQELDEGTSLDGDATSPSIKKKRHITH
jgi:hypothetical protein